MNAPSIDLSPLRYLIIDDNKFIRRLLAAALHSWGASDIREAGSGDEAWEGIESFPPDLIFCDWMMRPTDGLAFLRRLRAYPNAALAHIPVIMLTAHASPDHVAAAMGEGADSYIVKPFASATLLTHILQVLTGQKVHLVD